MTAVTLPQPSKIKVHTMVCVQYQVINTDDILYKNVNR